MNRITRLAAITAAALACTAAPAFAADDSADYTTESVKPSWTAASAESCADPDVAPLLSAFNDDDLYAPAPGGTFDDGAAGWALSGGTGLVTGDGALGLFGSGGSALEIPVGGTATSPTFCVDERYPHFRFAYASGAPVDDADVRVEVIYPGLAEKNVRKAKDLKAKRGKGWELSDKIKLDPSHGLKKGGWRLLAVRIGVRGGKPGTTVRVDDVLIDPRARF